MALFGPLSHTIYGLLIQIPELDQSNLQNLARVNRICPTYVVGPNWQRHLYVSFPCHSSGPNSVNPGQIPLVDGNIFYRIITCDTHCISFFLWLVSFPALNPMPLDSAYVEEVFAVPTEGVSGWLVDSLQVFSQGLHVRTQEPAEMTPTLFWEQDSQVAVVATAGPDWRLR